MAGAQQKISRGPQNLGGPGQFGPACPSPLGGPALDYFWLLWVANFDINLNNFICCTVQKAQNKISKRTYIV